MLINLHAVCHWIVSYLEAKLTLLLDIFEN